VVLGADSQGTIESGGARTEIKGLIKLKKLNARTGILYSGDVNYAEYMIDKFQSTSPNQDENVTKIANDFRKMCIKENEEHAGIQVSSLPQYSLIISGLDGGKKNIPKCYSMNSGSGFRLGKYPSGYGIGGKPFIAHFLFRKNYSNTKNVDEICKLVAQSIYDTKKVDGDVGGVIRLAIIDKGGFREVLTADIYNEYITTWQ